MRVPGPEVLFQRAFTEAWARQHHDPEDRWTIPRDLADGWSPDLRRLESLVEVCDARGLSFSDVATAIAVASEVRTGGERDWTREPPGAVIDHVVSTYHDALRDELPRLEAMAAKVTRVHGAKAPFLAVIQDVVGELSADLNEHMHKEETVLFPAIRALNEGVARHAAWIDAPIAVMYD